MSHRYQELDRAGGFDYGLYPLSQLGSAALRGPAVNLSRPYVAFIGSAQTFGRFAAAPFPALLTSRLGVPALNLAAGGAGPRHFLRAEYRALLDGAEAVVVQVMSGRSASKPLFDNTESGGMVGRVRAEPSTARADDFFARLAQSSTPSEFDRIVEETRRDYVASFIALLRSIVAPKILFWFSTRAPRYTERRENLPYGVFGAFPQLVNQSMARELASFADDYVECVSSEGLPQALWPSDQPIEGGVVHRGVLENRYYPSPAMHVAAADALEGPCRRMLGRYAARPSRPPGRATSRFVVVASARTGTNLLLGLLNDFEGCFVGSELFNVDNLARDILPWRDLPETDRPALLALRKRDPIAFWDDLCERSANRGFRTVGFKLLYSQGLAQKALLDHLAADATISIIHLKRRNLLRRLVSERQAQATSQWAVSAASAAEPRPTVGISMSDVVTSLCTVESQQATFDALFAKHPVLNLVYEDLARRPVRTAQRAAEFLGLPNPATVPTVKHRKTGHEVLAESLSDSDDLRAKMRRWAALFDE